MGEGVGTGGGGGWRGVNDAWQDRVRPFAETRTSTSTGYPGGALPTRNQNVRRPVGSARSIFLRLPVWKRATTVIRACGAVETLMSAVVPSAGRLRLAAAEQVSGGCVGAETGAVVPTAWAAGAAVCCADVQPAAARTIAMAATVVASNLPLLTKLPHFKIASHDGCGAPPPDADRC